jgi:alpha-methylacyl-CoA racemase
VLGADEAPYDQHNLARETFVEIEGITQPAPAPKFSRTRAGVPTRPPLPGEHTRAMLAAWGLSPRQISAWERIGVIRQHTEEEPLAPSPAAAISTRSTA